MASDQSDPLADWRWNKRLLVWCPADEAEGAKTEKVLTYTSMDWDGFAERDLLLVEMTPKKIQTVQAKVWDSVDKWGSFAWLPHLDAGNNLRNLASCQRDDEFILIGKDGTVKRVWQNIVPMEELFATIDAMPMRQREMRERSE